MSATQIWVVFYPAPCNSLPSAEVTKHSRADLLMQEVAKRDRPGDDLEARRFGR